MYPQNKTQMGIKTDNKWEKSRKSVFLTDIWWCFRAEWYLCWVFGSELYCKHWLDPVASWWSYSPSAGVTKCEEWIYQIVWCKLSLMKQTQWKCFAGFGISWRIWELFYDLFSGDASERINILPPKHSHREDILKSCAIWYLQKQTERDAVLCFFIYLGQLGEEFKAALTSSWNQIQRLSVFIHLHTKKKGFVATFNVFSSDSFWVSLKFC